MMEVPFERAVERGTQAVLTDEQFAARQADIRQAAETDNAEFVVPGGAATVTPPSHWLERGQASRQASLIVDPPDGRLPPMTEDGQRRAAAWSAAANMAAFAGPEDFTVYDRCITRGVLGSAFPNIYSSGTHILQVPGFVIIRHEMIHEARIVPLDGRPHLPGAIRLKHGRRSRPLGGLDTRD